MSCIQICPVLSFGVFISAVWIKEIASSGKQELPEVTVDALCAPTRKGCLIVCEISVLDKLPGCLSLLILAPAFISRCSGLCVQMKLPLNILITCQTLALSVVRVALGVFRKGSGDWKYTPKIAKKLKTTNKAKQSVCSKKHLSLISLSGVTITFAWHYLLNSTRIAQLWQVQQMRASFSTAHLICKRISLPPFSCSGARF